MHRLVRNLHCEEERSSDDLRRSDERIYASCHEVLSGTPDISLGLHTHGCPSRYRYIAVCGNWAPILGLPTGMEMFGIEAMTARIEAGSSERVDMKPAPYVSMGKAVMALR